MRQLMHVGPLSGWDISERRCGRHCGEWLWVRVVAGVEVLVCPECDRQRCSSCKKPMGRLLESSPALCEHCGHPTAKGLYRDAQSLPAGVDRLVHPDQEAA